MQIRVREDGGAMIISAGRMFEIQPDMVVRGGEVLHGIKVTVKNEGDDGDPICVLPKSHQCIEIY
jgi:hypothetical protein